MSGNQAQRGRNLPGSHAERDISSPSPVLPAFLPVETLPSQLYLFNIQIPLQIFPVPLGQIFPESSLMLSPLHGARWCPGCLHLL